MPLESLHSTAFKAAEIVRCAADQGKYWEMRARLFANPQTITTQASAHAAAVGLDVKRFDACVASGQQADGIRKDLEQAMGAGVEGTPSFFIGVTDPKTGRMKPLRFISGMRPFAAFKSEIDAVLREQTGGR